jgi:hypothetical protein
MVNAYEARMAHTHSGSRFDTKAFSRARVAQQRCVQAFDGDFGPCGQVLERFDEFAAQDRAGGAAPDLCQEFEARRGHGA